MLDDARIKARRDAILRFGARRFLARFFVIFGLAAAACVGFGLLQESLFGPPTNFQLLLRGLFALIAFGTAVAILMRMLRR